MHYAIVAKFLAAITFTVTVSMGFPFIWAVADGSRDIRAFMLSALIGAGMSAVLAFAGRGSKQGGMGAREAIACVALAWIVASFIGCLPYIFDGTIPSFTDAYFEAMSGFTTTGASVIREMEPVPRGILMWRATTHWLGGMGIVVLVIAMLPLLGGNMTYLFKAESPGPTLDKVSPRITEMATTLWKIYVGITVAGVVLLMAGEMNFYDAIAHSFSAVSTGGFSTHTASVAYYDSAYLDYVLVFLMFACGANFTLHFAALRARTLKPYKEPEFLFYTGVIVIATALICGHLLWEGIYSGFWEALRFSSFQVVSVITTTGFITADYARWPYFTQLILLAIMMIGGCAGSTAGAIKCVRFQIVIKAAFGELKKLIHPNAVVVVRQGEKAVNPQMVSAASCFIAIYFMIWGLSAIAVSFTGNDIVTSISAVSATLSNVGPGLADVGPVENFADQAPFAKWVYIFDMLCGRLEIYTLLALFTRGLWRR